MYQWGQFPFVRLLIPFVIGIIAAVSWETRVENLVWFLTGIVILYILLVVFVFRRLQYSLRWIPGVIILIILFIGGYGLVLQRLPHLQENQELFSKQSQTCRIEIIEPLSEKPRSYKTIGRILNLKDSVGWHPSSAKLLIYFEKKEKVRKLDYGDQIILSGNLQSISPPRNPGEFNYQRYLIMRGITHQVYVKGKDWEVVSNGIGNPFVYYGLALRNIFLNILSSNGISGSEFAVASALLLGYDDYLDREQKRQFAGAGAMHILCVSGLHVGILAFLMEFLLGFMNRKKILRLIKIVLLIGTIWMYAAITGFSPSVMRASTMFSFIILGRSLNRKANIFNMLAASAFVLLLINPLLLTEVGFQLSYLAVLGIVLLYKPIYNLINLKIKPLDWVWQITVVSIAATVSTLPLSLYYFHQVPVLFFITNLIAIPAATIIIYLGLLVLITSFIPIISSALAYVLSLVILGLNYSVAWIEGLSFSVIHGIYITQIELIILMTFLITLISLVYSKKKMHKYILLGLVVLFLFSATSRRFNAVRQNKIIVYAARKASAIDFIHGKNTITLCDSAFVFDPLLLEFSVKGNWINSGINNHELVLMENDITQNEWFFKEKEFLYFFDKRLLIVNPHFSCLQADKKLEVNYIIVSNNPKISMEQLLSSYQFDLVIFDLSNPYWKVRKWCSECEEMGIPYYNVQQDGAWVQNI